MHVPNPLVAPEVAILGGVAAAVLIVSAVVKLRKNRTFLREKLPLAGALGAFVFAAQMVNYPLAEIGCSGHLVGGILLAAMLGPWLGFLTLSSVVALQALLFADGGLMALGCNIINMAAISCLVAYPLIFKPLMGGSTSPARGFATSVISSIGALALGALAVVVENAASGGVALPVGEFMGAMLPVHLLIGAIEGAIVGAIVAFSLSHEPSLLDLYRTRTKALVAHLTRASIVFAVAALITGGVLSLAASDEPDGLEWAIAKSSSQAATPTKAHATADELQEAIAIAPDYEGDYTGLVATAGILLLAWAITPSRKKEVE